MIYIIIAIVVLLVIYVLTQYNSFVKLRNTVKEAFSTMDIYLKKRWDLIPNLVETVKGYAKHESETLEKIVDEMEFTLQNSPDREVPSERIGELAMEKLKDIDAQFINSGVAGDTIAEMGARLAYDVFPYKPDIIIMQGGANDFLMSLYPGARVLAERLIRLARRIREQLPDTKIYIESMYPAYTKRIGLMPSWAEGKSNKEIQKINTEIQRLCKQDNFEYVDVFDKLIGEDGQLSREYTVDGIHLQENAYDVVAAIIYHLMEG